MKTIEQRAKEWGEYITERTSFDVIASKYSYIAGANAQKEIDDAELLKLKMKWEREAQINHDIVMKSIKERAKLASEDYACDDRYSAGFFTGYVEGATKQQAINEEVRLKKSDDMTKAEYNREVAFADWYHQNGKSTPTFSDAIEWARKQTIDEACEWFSDYLFDIGYSDDWERDSENIISGEQRFRKAMEK